MRDAGADAVPDPHAGPSRPATPSRRVAMAGGVAAVAGLAAACAVGGSDPSSAPTGSSGTSNGTGSAAGSGTAQPAAIVALADVPVGGAMAATIDGAPAVVARPKDRTVAAFSARCTHMGCTVAVAGAKLQCPCHGSQFDALTGAVLRGPATEALPKISVHLDGDEVVAG